jgi:ubiquinone biosynthesis protein COQ4
MDDASQPARQAQSGAAFDGMNAEETAYMRGGVEPIVGSLPLTTSKYLNSPLFVHAYSTMALRRAGPDVPVTYDIPNMSRALADVSDPVAWSQAIEIEKARNPGFAAWLGRRRLTRYDPHDMQHYKAGTLGAEIRDFMMKSGFSLEFVNKVAEPRSDLEYVMVRNGHCHDIQHMVSGFGPNMAGEHALAVMNVTGNATHFSPELAHAVSLPNVFVSSVSYMRTGLHYPSGMPILIEAHQRGAEAGRTIRTPLLIVDWEDYLDWGLEDIAADLGFSRGPGDAWRSSDDLLQG